MADIRTEGKASMTLSDPSRLKEKFNLLLGQKPSPKHLNLADTVKQAAERSYKLAAETTQELLHQGLPTGNTPTPGMDAHTSDPNTGRVGSKIQAWNNTTGAVAGNESNAAGNIVNAAAMAAPKFRMGTMAAQSLGMPVAQEVYNYRRGTPAQTAPVPTWDELGNQYTGNIPQRLANGLTGGTSGLVSGTRMPVGNAVFAGLPSALGAAWNIGKDLYNTGSGNYGQHLTNAAKEIAPAAPGLAAQYAMGKHFGGIKNLVRTPLGMAPGALTGGAEAASGLKMLGRLGARSVPAALVANGGQALYHGVKDTFTDQGQAEHMQRLGDLALREKNMGLGGRLANTLGDYAGGLLTGDTTDAAARTSAIMAGAGMPFGGRDAADTMDHAVREGTAAENAYKAHTSALNNWSRKLGLPSHIASANPEYAQAYNDKLDMLTKHFGSLADRRTYLQNAGQHTKTPAMPESAAKYDYLTDQEKQQMLQEFGPAVFGARDADGNMTSVLDDDSTKHIFNAARQYQQTEQPQ